MHNLKIIIKMIVLSDRYFFDSFSDFDSSNHKWGWYRDKDWTSAIFQYLGWTVLDGNHFYLKDKMLWISNKNGEPDIVVVYDKKTRKRLSRQRHCEISWKA